MEIVKRVFDKALVIKLKSRTDNRGPMTVAYGEELAAKGIEFIPKETRVYTMPKKERFQKASRKLRRKTEVRQGEAHITGCWNCLILPALMKRIYPGG